MSFKVQKVPLKSKKVWRPCNLSAFIHSSTGPVVHPFASRHGDQVQSQGGTYVKAGFSFYRCIATLVTDPDVMDHCGLF
jgi:hypothetical protein